eukprot:TRINITY_DN15261_c0_g1_i1.p1 TRINITY_DN15261_c0_g1~~TRINITY_DN15261_c0_g1_i1.p1  ORF type:complete len:378 (+),score=32.42 TRINITY_DN15261_c0_g1_i1:94-1134(+)
MSTVYVEPGSVVRTGGAEVEAATLRRLQETGYGLVAAGRSNARSKVRQEKAAHWGARHLRLGLRADDATLPKSLCLPEDVNSEVRTKEIPRFKGCSVSHASYQKPSANSINASHYEICVDAAHAPSFRTVSDVTVWREKVDGAGHRQVFEPYFADIGFQNLTTSHKQTYKAPGVRRPSSAKASLCGRSGIRDTIPRSVTPRSGRIRNGTSSNLSSVTDDSSLAFPRGGGGGNGRTDQKRHVSPPATIGSLWTSRPGRSVTPPRRSRNESTVNGVDGIGGHGAGAGGRRGAAGSSVSPRHERRAKSKISADAGVNPSAGPVADRRSNRFRGPSEYDTAYWPPTIEVR